MKYLLAAGFMAAFVGAAPAQTECYGDYPYRVCTTVTQRADGSMSITSRDSTGNTYGVDTSVNTSRNGNMTIESRDSLGNSYSVRTWTDSRGTHSRDSAGNVCSILNNGTTVGC